MKLKNLFALALALCIRVYVVAGVPSNVTVRTQFASTDYYQMYNALMAPIGLFAPTDAPSQRPFYNTDLQQIYNAIYNLDSVIQAIGGGGGSDSSWRLIGNSNVRFRQALGTTDSASLRFMVDGTLAGIVSENESNTGLGFKCFINNTTGTDNTGIGFKSLRSNTTGFGNTGVGSNSLFKNSTGVFNTACGTIALENNTVGFENTAIGYGALNTVTDGNANTAIGVSALFNSNGSDNTVIGFGTLSAATTGSLNVAIGSGAFNSFPQSGFGNIGIGYQCNVAREDVHDAVVIGREASADNNGLAIGFNQHADSNQIALAGYTKLKLPLNGPVANYVLTTDGAGNASWQIGGTQLYETGFHTYSGSNTPFPTPVLNNTDRRIMVGGLINIFSVTTDVLQFSVSYTDPANNVITKLFYPAGTTSADLTSAGSYTFPSFYINVKGGTTIAFNSILTVSGGSISYEVDGTALYVPSP